MPVAIEPGHLNMSCTNGHLSEAVWISASTHAPIKFLERRLRKACGGSHREIRPDWEQLAFYQIDSEGYCSTRQAFVKVGFTLNLLHTRVTRRHKSHWWHKAPQLPEFPTAHHATSPIGTLGHLLLSTRIWFALGHLLLSTMIWFALVCHFCQFYFVLKLI